MIEELLPPNVVSVDTFEDRDDAWLFPEEAALVGKAVERRRREFTTGRACARRALCLLGAPVGPLLHGQRGAPMWPTGVVGSITHCDGYRAAAVGRERDVLTSERGSRTALPGTQRCAGIACCSAPRSQSTKRGFR